jgi:hypothetical protein
MDGRVAQVEPGEAQWDGSDQLTPAASTAYARLMEQAKAPYEKPELVVIDLKADEVLAVGCKLPPRTASGGRPCLSNRCQQRGS